MRYHKNNGSAPFCSPTASWSEFLFLRQVSAATTLGDESSLERTTSSPETAASPFPDSDSPRSSGSEADNCDLKTTQHCATWRFNASLLCLNNKRTLATPAKHSRLDWDDTKFHVWSKSSHILPKPLLNHLHAIPSRLERPCGGRVYFMKLQNITMPRPSDVCSFYTSPRKIIFQGQYCCVQPNFEISTLSRRCVPFNLLCLWS